MRLRRSLADASGNEASTTWFDSGPLSRVDVNALLNLEAERQQQCEQVPLMYSLRAAYVFIASRICVHYEPHMYSLRAAYASRYHLGLLLG